MLLLCYCYVIVMLLLFNYYFYCFTKILCHVLPPRPPCLLSVSNAQSKSQRLNPGLFLVISEVSSNCQLFEIDFFHFEGITRFFVFVFVIVFVYNNNTKNKQTKAGHKKEIHGLKKLL